MQLTKVTDLLNSEGMILGLYKAHENIYLRALVKSTGYVTFQVEITTLLGFYQNRLTIEDMLRQSSSFLVDFETGKKSNLHLKEDFYGKLHLGDKRMNDFGSGTVVMLPLGE